MKKTRWTLCMALSAVLALLLVGCAPRGKAPEDSELIARAEELAKKSEVLMDLFFVHGIPTEQDRPIREAGYTEADRAYLSRLGFSSYADIEAYARGIYTAENFSSFESIAVKPFSDGTALLALGYCYDAYDKDDGFICLMVSEDGVHRQTDPTEYDYSTLKVEKKTAQKATLTVTVKVTDRNDSTKQQTRQKTLYLTCQSGTWLLDSLTCITYSQPVEA